MKANAKQGSRHSTTSAAQLEDLRAGRRSHEIPKHGTLARVRQQIPAERRAGPAIPGEAGQPVWLTPKDEASETTA